MDAIAAFADHVVGARREDFSQAAIDAAKTYILDSYGVGVVGSAGPWVDELVRCQRLWGEGEQARVWVRGDALPAPAAAMCNAYQIHNSEYDCVHEGAVVHPMAVLLSATTAFAERQGGISGRELLSAVMLGVDVACHIGVAAKSPLKFFRPATAGAFAATASIGRLMGFDAGTLVNAFGAVYGQLCGNMQAHTEGSMLLGMQIGFNARNAIVACDMAAGGVDAAKNVLEGPYGYLNLFEDDYDLSDILPNLGKVWRMAEVSHKPFPSGRATHGVIDGVMDLQKEHGFAASEVEHVKAVVPPLVHRLVGRPIKDDMEVNYARLCVCYLGARALINGTVGVEDFAPEARGDAASLALGRRFEIVIDDNPDPNALVPLSVTVTLKDGTRHELTVGVMYGSPARPMTREAHLAKFRRNWQVGAKPLDADKGETFIAMVDDLESVGDVREFVDLMVA